VVDETGLAQGAGGAPRNTDNDGLADFRDLDSDNDGASDLFESFGLGPDADDDGILDELSDTDGDGVDDAWQSNIQEPADTDGDGILDARQLDSDGDGLTDLYENGGDDVDGDGRVDNFIDEDANGFDDRLAVFTLPRPDTDGDGDLDFRDLDSDNDGISDLEEAGSVDANGDGAADEPLLGSAVGDINGNDIPDHLEVDGGIIRTGLAASGCSIGAPQSAGFDPMLPLLSLFALVYLGMRRLRKIVLLLLSLPLLFTGCAHWSDERGQEYPEASSFETGVYSGGTPYRERRIENHVYVGAGLGFSQLEPDTSEVTGWDVNDKQNPGGQITVGLDLSRQLALELHSADLGSAGLSPRGRINYHVTGGSALLYAGKNRHRYRRQGLRAYGRLGVAQLDNSAVGDVIFLQENSAHVLFGLGVEYMTGLGLGFRADSISFEEDINFGQLGQIYRFGRKQSESKTQVLVEETVEPVVVPPVAAIKVEAPVVAVCSLTDGVLEGVNFHTDSAQLTQSGMDSLDATAEALKSCARDAIEISAHTDSVGSASYNQTLSERRALSVVDYLDGKGVNTARLQTKAMGESQPLASNNTRQDRAKNRRVELKILDSLNR